MTLWWNPLKFTMQAGLERVQYDEMRKMKGDKMRQNMPTEHDLP